MYYWITGGKIESQLRNSEEKTSLKYARPAMGQFR